jgi:hypothetical protein
MVAVLIEVGKEQQHSTDKLKKEVSELKSKITLQYLIPNPIFGTNILLYIYD